MLYCDWPPGRFRNTTNCRATAKAVARPRSSSTSAKARSIPAVTPADVQTAPSRMKIGSGSTRTAGWRRASSAQRCQCVTTRRPVEQSGLGQEKGTAAHGCGSPRRRRLPAQPLDEGAIGPGRVDPVSSSDEQRVGPPRRDRKAPGSRVSARPRTSLPAALSRRRRDRRGACPPRDRSRSRRPGAARRRREAGPRDRPGPRPGATGLAGNRPGPAVGTGRHCGARLHRQPPLAVDLDLHADLEAGHVDQRCRAATTVEAQPKALRLAVVRSRKIAEGLRRAGGSLRAQRTLNAPHAPTRRAVKRWEPGPGCTDDLGYRRPIVEERDLRLGRAKRSQVS